MSNISSLENTGGIPDLIQLLAATSSIHQQVVSDGVGGVGNVHIEELGSGSSCESGGGGEGDSSDCKEDTDEEEEDAYEEDELECIEGAHEYNDYEDGNEYDTTDLGYHDDEEDGNTATNAKVECAKVTSKLLIAISTQVKGAQSILINPLATACSAGNVEVLELLLSNQMFCARESMRVLISIAVAYPVDSVALAMFNMIKSAASACILAVSDNHPPSSSASSFLKKKMEEFHFDEILNEEEADDTQQQHQFPACFTCLNLAAAAHQVVKPQKKTPPTPASSTASASARLKKK